MFVPSALIPSAKAYLTLVLGAFLLGLVSAQPVRAECPLEDEHELWIVNSRSAPCCGDLTAGVQRLRYQRYEQGHWRAASLEELLAAPPAATCFLLPGNRADAATSVEFGWKGYRSLAPHTKGQPFRAIVWSWPADRSAVCNRADVRDKAPISDAQGYYLAWLVDQLPPDTPICLIGFSFGARMSEVALHLLDGGAVAGRKLGQRTHSERAPLRAVALAAASDNDWLLPGRRHGQALNAVDRFLNLYDSADVALRFYGILDRQRSPDSLGYTGIRSLSALGVNRDKFAQRDVAPAIGRGHEWRAYFQFYGCVMAPYVFRESAPSE